MTEIIEHFCEAALNMAKDVFYIDLDYSDESIQSLEQILDQLFTYCQKLADEGKFISNRRIQEMWDTLSFVSELFGEEDVEPIDEGLLSESSLWLISKIWGSYLGEVLRIKYGGDWTDFIQVEEKTTLVLNVKDIQIVPAAKVFKRLTNGPEDNVWKFYKVLCIQLQNIIS